MFKTILAATDGSEHARKAVELASDIAKKYEAKLFLLHAFRHENVSDQFRHMAEVEHLVEPGIVTQPDVTNVPAEVAAALRGANDTNEALRRASEAMGRQIIERAERIARAKGVKEIHTIVEEGEAVHQILETAKRQNADLVVVGSRGLGNLKALVMGSVSYKVSQLAECTCVTVK